MKENFKLGGILLVICVIAASLLGAVNNLTKEAILENSKISQADLTYLLSEADSIKDAAVELKEESNIKEVYEAVKGTDIIGHVIKFTSKGFHGDIDFAIAISEDKITGLKVMAHNETPGLGAKIKEEEFTARFRNKPIKEYLKVVKVEPSSDNEVQAVTGATVSSNATINGVNEAIAFYLTEIKGEEVAAPDVETSASSSVEEGLDVETGASSDAETSASTEGTSN
ncbi:RnfABCDGE type electron transport complex subunit G [Clostridium isatidis]|uniref:Ion-translocating oxidoreductase complex subunit G n=1 Tax=Clostridium isatidis TaxID=182773 RepID=A0A343JBX5_9CLOT|nr:RnfABCDGE type electron transport complex subunit G [Clostridium isatidis]ASW43033.1 RnfABCDGE type electron transport complex subunit G [Clostridium isatidis]NLZ35537.1 RnfABCDGE type electron transport complex subunit G [Clostridiales bacterium]